MSRRLYFDENGLWGKLPSNPEEQLEYEVLTKVVNLKNDFGWKEVADLQKIIAAANAWRDFPAEGYTLITAENKIGDEDQRIDLLYLRNDGALVPCELKIGGTNLNTHGQLIRYIADLWYLQPNIEFLENLNKEFRKSLPNSFMKIMFKDTFDSFISKNNITDRFVRVLSKTGFIIDEGFPSQILKSVRYLNDECGFSLRLIKIEAHVDPKWDKSWTNYKFRLDFIDIS